MTLEVLDLEACRIVTSSPPSASFPSSARTSDDSNFSAADSIEKKPLRKLSLPVEVTGVPESSLHNGNDDLEIPANSRSSRVYRWLRWNFFSTYRRLFSLVFLVNLGVIVTLTIRTFTHGKGFTYHSITTSAAVNLLVSILMRHEHFVNLLFRVSTLVPRTAPFWVRTAVAKIYGYGGLHSGCAVAAVFWYITFVGLVTYEAFKPPFVDASLLIITHANLLLLLVIIAFSHPALRTRLHNWFEATHRFAGWTSIGLFWAQTMLLASKAHTNNPSGPTSTLGRELVVAPAFWCITIITIIVVYPWTRLSKHSVTAEPLSDHAVRLHFSHRNVDYCEAIRLGDKPLKETHAFAAIARSPAYTVGPSEEPSSRHDQRERKGPNIDSAPHKGFSVVVSKAGDWTSRIIANPPTHLYIRGTPTYGVLRIAVLFSPVLIVATGSGIGPCLSLFRGRPTLDCRILWSTPSPVETYGREIVEEVKRADPCACIVDTRKCGRPDLVKMSWKMWKKGGCEAVVLISNPKVTSKVVFGLESRGVAAFAPIFDS